jgi:hypothetical protein
MKLNLALLTGGAIVLAPAMAAASQPTQTPTGQDATKTQSAPDTKDMATNPTGAADAAASCDATSKSSTDTKAVHPSAKVGKDTGDLPPPRKKVSKEATCTTQPQ